MASRLRAPFPFVAAHEPQLLAGARAIWDRLLADFGTARKRLLVENYIYEDGRAGEAVTGALVAAAARGVAVQVLADSLGSMRLGSRTVARLEEAGAQVRFFNPIRLARVVRLGHLPRLLRRTHRRIFAVDGRIAWVGGLAFADLWWPENGGCPTRETMLRIQGPAVGHLEEAFQRLWKRPLRSRRARPIPPARPGELRVVPQDPRRGPWFRRALKKRLRAARERAWLATPYFIPPRAIRRRLRAACRRGADVRLLLPGRKHDHPAIRLAGRRYYGTLLRAGVRIFEYQPCFLHAKQALFDAEWSLVGSPNLDRWSLFHIHEIALEARDAPLARALARQFEADFAASREITLEAWRRRPLRTRLLEHFFGLFDAAF